MAGRRLGVIDTTFRSLVHLRPPRLATMGHLVPILELMDGVGFRAIDALGDMTFSHALQTLQESPWERLRGLAAHVTHTPLQMTLRGRCLLGFRPYGDDVIDEFVKQAADCGIRSFLVYDPLNDLRNLEPVTRAVKKAGGRLHVGLVYSGFSGPKLKETAILAGSLADLGGDSLCLKTASALGFRTAESLVSAMRKAAKIPVEVDLDNAGGLAALAAVTCVRAGAEVVYASAAPPWLDPNGLAAPLVLGGLVDGGLTIEPQMEPLGQVTDFFATLSSAEHASAHATPFTPRRVDWSELWEVSGAVVDQVAERLSSQAAEQRLPEVIHEILKVRFELGMPALVPPLAQIVATQAVLNVLYGRRWQVVSDEMMGYLRGSYGEPPMPISAEVRGLIRDTQESEGFRAELTLEDVRDGAPELAESIEHLLLHALAPDATMAFLSRRRLACEIELSARPVEEADTGEEGEDWGDIGPERIRELVSLLETSGVDELTVESKGTKVSLRKSGGASSEAPAPEPTVPGDAAVAAIANSPALTPVVASMVGTFYASPTPGTPPYVVAAQRVKTGDVLCILEAMKLMNEVVSDLTGRVAAVLVEDGAAVEYGQPLFLIDTGAE